MKGALNVMDRSGPEFVEIQGGVPLHGTVRVSGAKNSALLLMAAALLFDDECVLRGVPHVADVINMQILLRSLGIESYFEDCANLRLKPSTTPSQEHNLDVASMLRASICVTGPLLAKRGYVRIPKPGGCSLGGRSIAVHLRALAQLGACVRLADPWIELRSPGLRAACISPQGDCGISVTATANTMLASCLATGTTILTNAAREPEIEDLAMFLNACGARISGHGTSEIVVHGVQSLSPAEHIIMSDRIEAGTYAIAAAATGGRITLTNVRMDHLGSLVTVLRAAGQHIQESGDECVVEATGRVKGVNVQATPYPGFPTDLQPQLTALLAGAAGKSVISDTVFPNRFDHVSALVQMGAWMWVANGAAHVQGVHRLRGTTLVSTDLRCGAALLIAGLTARGRSVIYGMSHLKRGYEDFLGKLQCLGANVTKHSGRACLPFEYKG